MEWISIEDEFPPEGETVLCADIYNSFVSFGKLIMVAHPHGDDTYEFELMYNSSMDMDSQVTHWMPLPELPKQEKENGMD